MRARGLRVSSPWMATLSMLLLPAAAHASEPVRVDESIEVVAGTPMRGASAQRRTLSLHGLPLRGGFETIWRSHDGHERVVAARYPRADPVLLPEQARVSLAAARARAEALTGARTREGELVYVLLLEQPVLAWEIETELRLTPTPSRARVWISAKTGMVLEHEELVVAENQAWVYDVNPVETPEPSLVTLTNLELGPGHLTGSRVQVFNCIDEPDGPYGPWREEDECYPTQRVLPDADGNYFVPLPNVAVLDDNKNPQDLYAELAMYWHAEKFFTHLAALGVDEFPCERSNLVVNFHRLLPNETPNWSGYSNAYYTGVCDVEEGPTMLVGQGSQVDFAYDGDVVYHELGHGIVEQLTPAGLTGYRYRSDGTLRDARGINEAIADYHSIILTDNPQIGEYIGAYTPSSETLWFRNAENEARCPDDLNGEEHTDGVPLTGALWSARARIGGDKLDPVVLGSLPLLAGDATLEDAAAALLEVAAAEVEAGSWSAVDLELLERSLAGRNLLDCLRVVDQPARFEEPRKVLLRAKSEYVSPFWPGPLQYRHVVPDGSDNLIVSFEVSNFQGTWDSGELEPLLLVKRSSTSEDAPLEFQFELDEEAELWHVTGDWEEIHGSTRLTDLRREVLLRDLAPGEVVHVMFVTRDAEATVLRELRFASVPSEDLDHGSPSPWPDDPMVDVEEPGCTCTSRDLGGRGAGLATVALFVLAGCSGRLRSRGRRGHH